MEWLNTLLFDPGAVSHILLIYSAVIAIGMALGKVKVLGVSLGVTFVLFAALAAGFLGAEVNPTVLTFLRDFGLILFVFFLGLQVGPSFVASFKSGGVQLNLLAVLAVFLSLAVTALLWAAFSGLVPLPQMLGLHFGAVTNTPGLGAAQETLDMLGYTGENIAVAYACSYPLGVIGIIATAIVLRKIFRIDLREEDKHWEEEAQAANNAPIFFHAEITNPAIDSRTIRQVQDFIGRPFIGTRLLHGGEITSPRPDTVLHHGDILRIVTAEENKEAIAAFFGRERTDLDLATERSPLIYQTIRVTRTSVNGTRIGDLHLSRFDGVNITRVFRAGMVLFPYRNLRLQLGDEVSCVGSRGAVERLAGRLGNQSKKLEHPNVIAIFLGIALGIALGSVPLAVPGLPVALKLGLAGGPLIVAILLGYYGPNLHLVTYTTNSANLMLRELGITLFLASVGLAAGKPFVAALLEGNGPLYAALGLVVTVLPLLAVGIIARRCFKLNYHSIVGLIAGATTDPPALAYAGTLSEKNSSAIAYSTVYPLCMFLRILSGQVMLLLLWGFAS